jgi:hypothetical protein
MEKKLLTKMNAACQKARLEMNPDATTAKVHNILPRYPSLGSTCKFRSCNGRIVVTRRIGYDAGNITNGLVKERFAESLIGASSPPVSAEEGREAVRIREMVVAHFRERDGYRLGSQNAP